MLKFVKYTFEHFQLFIIVMINHIMTYRISVMFILGMINIITYRISIYDAAIHQRYLRFFKKFINHLWISIPSSGGGDFQKKLSSVQSARSSCHWINSLAFRGNLVWNSLLSNVKRSHNLEEFKLKLRNLGNIHCTCAACRWNQSNDFIFLSLLDIFNASFILRVLHLKIFVVGIY